MDEPSMVVKSRDELAVLFFYLHHLSTYVRELNLQEIKGLPHGFTRNEAGATQKYQSILLGALPVTQESRRARRRYCLPYRRTCCNIKRRCCMLCVTIVYWSLPSGNSQGVHKEAG